jgi:hypothetical protein
MKSSSGYEIYHNTLSSVLDEVERYVQSKGYEVGDYFPEINHVSYGTTERTQLEMLKDGRIANTLAIQIYRLDSGKYELNCYPVRKFALGGGVESNTEKLILEIKKNSFVSKGIETTAKDGSGQKYRYDHYKYKANSAPNWIVLLFDKCAKENGKPFATQFNYKGIYSIHYDRNPLKNQPNGKIGMSELVLINSDGKFATGGKITFKKNTNNPNFITINIEYEIIKGSPMALGKQTMSGQMSQLSAKEAYKKGLEIGKKLELKYNIEDIEVTDLENGIVQVFAVSNDFVNMPISELQKFKDGGKIVGYEVKYEKQVSGERENDIKTFKTKEQAEEFAKENYGYVENVYEDQYKFATGGGVADFKIDKELLLQDFHTIKKSDLFKEIYFKEDKIEIVGGQFRWINRQQEKFGKYFTSNEVAESLKKIANRNYAYKIEKDIIEYELEYDEYDGYDEFPTEDVEFYLIPTKLKTEDSKILSKGGGIKSIKIGDKFHYKFDGKDYEVLGIENSKIIISPIPLGSYWNNREISFSLMNKWIIEKTMRKI